MKVKPNFLPTPEAKNYTVKSYLNQLDENVLCIKSFTEKYASHPFYAQLFIELFDKFVQARERAKKYFAGCSSDKPLVLAILDMFDNHLEPAQFLQKYEEFNTTLLYSLDNLYFDICCLDKVLSLCPQTSNKLALIVGAAHASVICDQLKKVGYRSILEEVNEFYIDGTADIFSGSLVNLELAFALFFSYGHIPAEVLPQLERLTNVAAENFKRSVANAIKNNANLSLTSSSTVKQYESNEILVSDFKVLTVQDNSISSASIVDYHCYNGGCQKKAYSICTRCRKARYCSRECQRADWQVKHKLECKLT